jgi:hypothetical protein
MASEQREELKAALAALQEKINEAEGKVVKSEERLEKAIIDGKTESVLASFKTLLESASANPYWSSKRERKAYGRKEHTHSFIIQ